ELQPELVLGTQMERHVAKRLGIACAVISAPVHVQDFPARYSPQMGFEGANVIFDTWVHPLMMGLEEHLIGMFREDSEFRDDASSHLGHGVSTAPDPSPAGGGLARQREPGGDARLGSPHPGSASPTRPSPAGEGSGARPSPIVIPATLGWAPEAERELGKIPFFVRGKARRNTESFAKTHGLALITLETLYDAKAHFGR
ncbi:nitrogenase component 1, partial [uncultured Enterovirga sp.]|uniref:nitrogenase component 1 n=1 Tax=uncultured Enterovirga sp. TaxID=2026352 RepID=UPI0035CCA6FD